MEIKVIVALDSAVIQLAKSLIAALTSSQPVSLTPTACIEGELQARKSIDAPVITQTTEETQQVAQADDKTPVAIKPEDVRAAVSAKTTAGKKDEVKALMTEFGVSRIPNLKQEQLADFIAKVNAL